MICLSHFGADEEDGRDLDLRKSGLYVLIALSLSPLCYVSHYVRLISISPYAVQRRLPTHVMCRTWYLRRSNCMCFCTYLILMHAPVSRGRPKQRSATAAREVFAKRSLRSSLCDARDLGTFVRSRVRRLRLPALRALGLCPIIIVMVMMIIIIIIIIIICSSSSVVRFIVSISIIGIIIAGSCSWIQCPLPPSQVPLAARRRRGRHSPSFYHELGYDGALCYRLWTMYQTRKFSYMTWYTTRTCQPDRAG